MLGYKQLFSITALIREGLQHVPSDKRATAKHLCDVVRWFECEEQVKYVPVEDVKWFHSFTEKVLSELHPYAFDSCEMLQLCSNIQHLHTLVSSTLENDVVVWDTLSSQSDVGVVEGDGDVL